MGSECNELEGTPLLVSAYPVMNCGLWKAEREIGVEAEVEIGGGVAIGRACQEKVEGGLHDAV